MTELSAAPAAAAASRRAALVRRGLPLLAVFVVLGTVGGFFASQLLPKHYTASARVLVNAITIGETGQPVSARTNDQVNLDTEAQVLKSQPVAARVRRLDPRLAHWSLADIENALSIIVPPNSAVLEISFLDSSPAAARAAANAFASAYLADRAAVAGAAVQAQIRAVQRQLATAHSQLQAVAARISGSGSSSKQVPYYTAQRELLVNQISGLNAELLSLQTTSVDPGRMLQRARTPDAPSSPSKILFTASGFALGILVGALAAWAAVHWRRKVRVASDVADVTDAPILAAVRSLDPNTRDWRQSESADVFRRLAVMTAARVQTPAAVLVVSVNQSAAGPVIATGLAGALGDDGARVELLHVGSDPAPTLAKGGGHAFVIDRLDELDRIAGASSLHGRLLAVRGDGDYLVIDSRDALKASDAYRIAPFVDAVVVVVAGGTRRRDLRAVIRDLDELGAPILGCVFARRVVSLSAYRLSGVGLVPGSASELSEPRSPRHRQSAGGDDRGSESWAPERSDAVAASMKVREDPLG